jgi:AraC-like DNA-binding protein
MRGVRYREHTPPLSLAAYVDCFWELTSGGEPHRVMPDGAMDIVFDVRAGHANVVGPMTRAIVTEASDPGIMVGVRFRPGAGPALLGIAAREVRDDAPPLGDVWGAHGRALEASVADAASVTAEDAIARIAQALEARRAQGPRPDERLDAAIAILVRAGGELPLGAVAAKVALGERQLERLFDERVGLGPKAFARVVRLQRTLRSIDTHRAVGSVASWARVAVEHGYADQAHLIRDFRALAGITPAAYAGARAMSEIDNPAHGPLAIVSA